MIRFLRLVRAVLWSIFGVRGRAEAARDLESVRPRTVIAVAVFVGLLVVGSIAALVRFFVADSTRPAAIEAPRPSPPETIGKTQQGPVVVRDTMHARVEPCTTCHGSATEATTDGFSPRIAGKPAGYLFNQLVSFRDGRRGYPPMTYIVQNLSDAYLREMAGHFAKLELPYPPPEPNTLSEAQSERARTLVLRGDASRGVPACVECHGERLTGVAPDIPGILGLPRQYMNAQFGAWRSGKLRSLEPDCMGEVARRLAPEDAAVLASWLAAQPVPQPMNAEAAPRRLPLECGSIAGSPSKSEPAQASPGRYLVTAGNCIACHTARGGAPFAGGRGIETPFGTVYSTNITPDAATGIGAWTREDFWRALHQGKSKDGRLLYPAFPYPNFTQVTRQDADAMYDYLRQLPAVERPNTPHALRFPYNTQAALAGWRALFFREGVFEPDASRGAEWNRGAYLVRALGHCDACHAGRNAFGAVSHSLDLGGGLIPMQNWYAPPLAAAWNPEHLVALLKSGVSPRGMAMGPMAEVVHRSTQHLTGADARAIASYLGASTPAENARAPAQPPAVSVMERGAAVYGKHCAQCHGDRGEGAHPAYPPLAGNPSVTAAVAANAIKAVLYGGYPPVTAANPRPYGMPSYVGRLNEAEIAAVVTYARNAWGNAAAPVSALEIERYR